MSITSPPVFRFAPSPNGELHLGHAYSALLNQKMAFETDGRFLIRIEDIDRSRCTPELEAGMLDDLRSIGIEWTETPVRQSEEFDRYRAAIERLTELGLIYPSFMSRGDIRLHVNAASQHGEEWPTDPDGSPIYPGTERDWTGSLVASAKHCQPLFALRLKMAKALEMHTGIQTWTETGLGPDGQTGQISADPAAWGDIVLARSDTPTSYHLSVVLDDAMQGVNYVVRGQDLFHATSVHRLLQEILDLPIPTYHHHKLILDDNGRKLSKSFGGTSVRSLRHAGVSLDEVRRMVGF